MKRWLPLVMVVALLGLIAWLALRGGEQPAAAVAATAPGGAPQGPQFFGQVAASSKPRRPAIARNSVGSWSNTSN